MRYERDGFSGNSVVAPRLSLSWQPDAVIRVWTGGGVYYQAPRYLDIGADPSNLALESERSTQLVLGVSRHLREDLRFSAEGYYQQLDDLIVFDDRTTNTATNIGEGSATGVDLMLAKRMSRGGALRRPTPTRAPAAMTSSAKANMRRIGIGRTRSVSSAPGSRAIDGPSRRNGNMLRVGPPMRSSCTATCWETQAPCATRRS